MDRRTHAKHIILILLGSLILSFGIYNLNYQNNITEGGVLGLLLLLKNLFNIEPSIANLIIDIALLIIAYKFFGKQFLIYSIIATFSFSTFYAVFESIGPLIPVLHSKFIVTILSGLFVGVGVGIIVRNGAAAGGDDALAMVISKITSLTIGNSKFIVTILSGLFVGVGVGIIVRNGAAAGGDDALAMVISKITSLTIGNVYLIGDVAILILSLTYLSAYDIFWSLIAVNISGRTIDFIYNFNKNELINI